MPNENDNQIAPGQTPRTGLGLYVSLFAIQTIGAVIVLANGIPIYRQITSYSAALTPRAGILWWAVVAIVLIQSAYWTRTCLRPPMPQFANVVLGHVAGFAARLSFIFSSSTFSAIFIARFDQLSLPPHRIGIVLLLLFSMFCWTLELERLAKALQGISATS